MFQNFSSSKTILTQYIEKLIIPFQKRSTTVSNGFFSIKIKQISSSMVLFVSTIIWTGAGRVMLIDVACAEEDGHCQPSSYSLCSGIGFQSLILDCDC